MDALFEKSGVDASFSLWRFPMDAEFFGMESFEISYRINLNKMSK